MVVDRPNADNLRRMAKLCREAAALAPDHDTWEKFNTLAADLDGRAEAIDRSAETGKA